MSFWYCLAAFCTFNRSWNLSTNLSQSYMPCSTSLKGGLINNKVGLRLFKISQKDGHFYLLWQPSALGDNLTMRIHFLHVAKKLFLTSSVWPRREYTVTLIWKESQLICFKSYQGVLYSHRQSRNWMVDTLVMVSFKPICKR